MGVRINGKRVGAGRRSHVAERFDALLGLLQHCKMSLPGGTVDSFVSGIERDLIHSFSDIDRTHRLSRDRVQDDQDAVLSGGEQPMRFRIDMANP